MFTLKDADKMAKKLGYDDPECLLEGMNHELEHKDITNGDALMTAKIALVHLKEDEDYYEKLKEMEGDKESEVEEKLSKRK